MPATLLDNATDVVPPEQMVCDDGVAVATGVGLTVMVTVIGAPPQLFAVGVMVYTAVPAVVPVAVNNWEMLAPLPFVAPDTPVCTTVQL